MAPKEESYFAPLNVVLARSSIKRISVAPTVEATRSGILIVARHHRALFRLTVRVRVDHTEGKERMIFRAYASKNRFFVEFSGWKSQALGQVCRRKREFLFCSF